MMVGFYIGLPSEILIGATDFSIDLIPKFS